MTSVLVVDDAETTRKFFRETLGDEYDLTLCGNWAETEDAIAEQAFDLVFLDCWLPDKEGISVLETLRDTYDGPVVMMSGYADRSIVEKARSRGISEFLEKPIEPDQIRQLTQDTLTASGPDDPNDTPDEPDLPEDITFYDDLRLLVVDDDASTRDLLAHPLDHYELDYRMATNADTAWNDVQSYDPNVVILDANLEEGSLSSPDLLDKIRSRNRDTFVIGITGYPESDKFEQLNRDDLSEFYYKPFSITKLLRSLSYLSFVIHKRNQSSDEPRQDENDDTEGSSSNLRRKIAIGLLAILVGLSLGFLIKWTRSLADSSTEDALSIRKMYQEIEGYLRRDEERDRRYQ